MRMKRVLVSEVIGVGKENAVSHKSIERACGLKTRRSLRQKIHNERLHGIPICPDGNGGYYLADLETTEGRLEWRCFVVTMRSMTAGLTEICNPHGHYSYCNTDDNETGSEET